MRRSLTLSALVLGAALLLPGLPAAAQEKAQLPAPLGRCEAAGCEGKDPSAFCQRDARTIDSLRLEGGLLELRHSPSCSAVWARITGTWDAAWQFAPRAKIIRDVDGKSFSCTYTRGDQRGCYTAMTNDRNLTAYAWGEYDTGSTLQKGRTGSY